MPSEIIVEFPSPLTDKEKKMIYGYKGEIVRCKDCIHYWNRNGVCDAHIDLIDVDDDCYCSWAERKDEVKDVKYRMDKQRRIRL